MGKCLNLNTTFVENLFSPNFASDCFQLIIKDITIIINCLSRIIYSFLLNQVFKCFTAIFHQKVVLIVLLSNFHF